MKKSFLFSIALALALTTPQVEGMNIVENKKKEKTFWGWMWKQTKKAAMDGMSKLIRHTVNFGLIGAVGVGSFAGTRALLGLDASTRETLYKYKSSMLDSYQNKTIVLSVSDAERAKDFAALVVGGLFAYITYVFLYRDENSNAAINKKLDNFKKDNNKSLHLLVSAIANSGEGIKKNTNEQFDKTNKKIIKVGNRTIKMHRKLTNIEKTVKEISEEVKKENPDIKLIKNQLSGIETNIKNLPANIQEELKKLKEAPENENISNFKKQVEKVVNNCLQVFNDNFENAVERAIEKVIEKRSSNNNLMAKNKNQSIAFDKNEIIKFDSNLTTPKSPVNNKLMANFLKNDLETKKIMDFDKN